MSQELITRPSGAAIATRGAFSDSVEVRGETAATAVAERAKAEVQARFAIAQHRPRNVLDVRARVLDHCKRPGFAAKARYRKPVGNTAVEGPSIRFVETALAEYSNVDTDTVVAFEDSEKILLRVSVTDLENNLTHKGEVLIRKTVERSSLRPGMEAVGKRQNTSGRDVYIIRATDEDLANKQAAAASKMLRGLGLKILPADVVEEAMQLCIDTLRDAATKDPSAERKKIADAFHSLGVNPAALVDYLGHPLERLEPGEIVELRAVYDGIRDGEASWSELLANRRAERGERPSERSTTQDDRPPSRGVAAVKARLQKRAPQDALDIADPVLPREERTEVPVPEVTP